MAPATKTIPVEQLTADVWNEWRLPPEQRAIDWVPENIVIPEETESPGRFDLSIVPHADGVLEAADDPIVRDIYLMWASRNAKTTTSMSLLIYFGVNKPRPMMYSNADEESANDAMDSQLYPLLDSCPATRDQLLPHHKRNKKFVRFARCRVRRAYAGSPITMRGFPACYGLASEVSAWPSRKSNDANALRLFGQRGKLFPFDRKYIYESTPALKGDCKISELFDAPGVDQRVRMVPCPHCGTYQELIFGRGEPDRPGICWEKPPGEEVTPQQAEETAWYQCKKGCRIENSDRAEMMRNGVWWPAGKPLRKRWKRNQKKLETPPFTSAKVGFGPLSTLYSLLIAGWGQIAREYLEARKNKEALRDFWNSTLCLLWDPSPKRVEPHQIGQRLATPEPLRLVPEWGQFLTRGVDVQDHGSEYHWGTYAWGKSGRGHLVDYGVCFNQEELEKILAIQYPHQDGGLVMPVNLTFIDSGDGNMTEVIYLFCKSHRGILPVKGSSTSAFAEPLRLRNLDDTPLAKRKVKMGGVQLVEVNTQRSQRWLQAHLDGDLPEDHPARLTIPQEASLDFDLLAQLGNEYAHDEENKRGYRVEVWTKKGPNEQRDIVRYAWAAAQYLTNFGAHWERLPERRPKVVNRQSVNRPKPTGFRNQHGEPYLVTER